jgi:hypothetical protein
MRRSSAHARSTWRALITIGALCCGALVGCGGGDTEFTETGPTTTTEEASVLGVTLTRPDVEAAAPAVPVPVESATTAPPASTSSQPATTRAAPPTTTTTAKPVTTTRLPKPNRFTGSYAARPGTDRVTVELFSNGSVFDTRELGAGGSFEFAGLPDGAYRVVITDVIDDDDPNDGNDTSSTVISASDSVGLTDGDTANAACSATSDCSTSVHDG